MDIKKVMKIARECRLPVEYANIGEGIMVGILPPNGLQLFASAIEATTREECARLCESLPDHGHSSWAGYAIDDCINAIRNMGK